MPNSSDVPRRIEKPWGYELIWADTSQYAGKVIHVNAGHALSLQYHDMKDETMYLLHGQMRLTIGPSIGELEVFDIEEGQSVRIEPRTVHRVEAITDVDILEVSTPQLTDVVRLEDRYGRA